MPEIVRSLVELVRVGAAGNPAGVRQLANRLVRHVPEEVTDPDAFRRAIGEALAIAPQSFGHSNLLRTATAEVVPTDAETSQPLATLDPGPNVDGLVLSDAVADVVDRLLRERMGADRLEAAGVTPVRTILLSGPPGVGKTMTAAYVASCLGLPLLTIDLASVMSSYLGRTGQNLRAALNFGKTHAAVVFVDEFDALAKRRDDDSDIGELKRLVNVLLLELERWPSGSLLVAATNHRHLLDGAIERRFDLIIELGLPGQKERERILANAGARIGMDERVASALAGLTDGASGADLTSMTQAAARRTVIDEEPFLKAIVSELGRRFTHDARARDQLCCVLHEELKLSNREIAGLLGVSHPTVGKALQRGTR
jgi:hypothetical protein